MNRQCLGNQLRAAEAARALGISLDTLRRWDRAGRIRVERDSANRRVVPSSEIERLRGPHGDGHLGAQPVSRRRALGRGRRPPRAGRDRRHGAGTRCRDRDPRIGGGARAQARHERGRRRQVDERDGGAVRRLVVCLAVGTARDRRRRVRRGTHARRAADRARRGVADGGAASGRAGRPQLLRGAPTSWRSRSAREPRSTSSSRQARSTRRRSTPTVLCVSPSRSRPTRLVLIVPRSNPARIRTVRRSRRSARSFGWSSPGRRSRSASTRARCSSASGCSRSCARPSASSRTSRASSGRSRWARPTQGSSTAPTSGPWRARCARSASRPRRSRPSSTRRRSRERRALSRAARRSSSLCSGPDGRRELRAAGFGEP